MLTHIWRGKDNNAGRIRDPAPEFLGAGTHARVHGACQDETVIFLRWQIRGEMSNPHRKTMPGRMDAVKPNRPMALRDMPEPDGQGIVATRVVWQAKGKIADRPPSAS